MQQFRSSSTISAFLLFFAITWLGSCSDPIRADLSSEDIAYVAEKVFQNECGGNEKYLVTWNRGEEFPSLGIGHFIWYPKGVRGPFTESFPALLAFAVNQGAEVPAGLTPQNPAPWSSRKQFIAQLQNPFTTDLRNWLKSNRDLQARFIIHRFNKGIPQLLEHVPPLERDVIAGRIQHLLASSQGTYALIDYTNFKGEGINPRERYRGQGWGLLQVLRNMDEGNEPLNAFADSASAMLERRVENSPPQRDEKRWLAGWLRRIDSYRPS